MNRLKKYLLPLLILTFFVSLIAGFRSFLITNIIEPIALLFWAVWRLVSSVDQNTYWIFLILICIVLIIYLVASGKKSPFRSAYHETNKTSNRVEYWQKLIKDAALGHDEKEYLRDQLKELLVSANIQAERSDTTDSVDIIEITRESLPLSTYQFLFPPKEKNRVFSIFQQLNIFFFVPKWLRRRVRGILNQDDMIIDEILQWMEKELEISYEK